MIQRIQTVFLFFATVSGILIFFFPIANFYADADVFSFYLYSVNNLTPDPFGDVQTAEQIVNPLYPLILSALQFIIIAVTLTTILKFKNRLLQIRLNYLNVFLNVLLIGGIFYLSSLMEQQLDTVASYGLGGVFPLITVTMLFLSNIFIRKDERLVRSADRLR
jgi:uncharacterized membrane protein